MSSNVLYLVKFISLLILQIFVIDLLLNCCIYSFCFGDIVDVGIMEPRTEQGNDRDDCNDMEKRLFIGHEYKAIVLKLPQRAAPQKWMLLQPFLTPLPDSINRPLADNSFGI